MSVDKRDEIGRQAVHFYLDAARERELIRDIERNEKELLRSARETELSHAPRREKEFILRMVRETIRANKRHASGPARFRLIGHVLRRAAGLPDVEDPFIERSDEAHLPNAGGFISMIFLVTSDFSPPNPRAVEDELENTAESEQGYVSTEPGGSLTPLSEHQCAQRTQQSPDDYSTAGFESSKACHHQEWEYQN